MQHEKLLFFRRSTREFHVIAGKPLSGNTFFMHNEAVRGI